MVRAEGLVFDSDTPQAVEAGSAEQADSASALGYDVVTLDGIIVAMELGSSLRTLNNADLLDFARNRLGLVDITPEQLFTHLNGSRQENTE